MNNHDRRAIWANKYFCIYEPGTHPRRPYVIPYLLHDTSRQAASRKPHMEHNVFAIRRASKRQ